MIQYNSIPAASVCIRNELLKKYINEVRPLDKDWKMEDYPMWLWFSMNSKIVYMDNRFIVYRVLENSISHQIDIEKQLSYQKSVIKHIVSEHIYLICIIFLPFCIEKPSPFIAEKVKLTIFASSKHKKLWIKTILKNIMIFTY